VVDGPIAIVISSTQVRAKNKGENHAHWGASLFTLGHPLSMSVRRNIPKKERLTPFT
jgi:hypothetical protein